MDEAFKTNQLRSKEFFDKYLSGKVIDIGAGKDLVTPYAERFDLEDGDANVITQFRPKNSYDAVHSSHCLEHMHNPLSALKEWWEIIKPGGHLVVVVPDEDLYEQGIWPSVFNTDHKNTFRLRKTDSWSPVSHDIEELVKQLPNATIISAERQDANYDYKFQTHFPTDFKGLPGYIKFFKRKILKKIPFINFKLLEAFDKRLFNTRQYPIDQTMYKAVAQIQIVAQKGY